MRWLFVFVFSLNLAYFAWEMSKSPTDDYTDVAALKNVQPIVLLSELKQQVDLVEAEPESVTEDKQGEDEAVISAGEDGSKGDLPEEQIAAEKLTVVQTTEKAQQILPEVVTAAKPEVAKQPDSIKLAEQVVASTKKVDPVKAVPAMSSQTTRCYTLGPFRDLDKLRGLTREIKSYVVEADFRGREENEQTLYWVYIKPEENRKKAIEAGNRLKAKKIKDFYIIRDGEKENGLSLGHFRSKDGAYGLAKKVKNLGFNVIVEPVFKTYTVYWLDYQLSSGVTIPDSIFDKYAKTTKKEKISRLSRDCGT